MGAVTVFPSDDSQWMVARDSASPEMLEQLSAGELDSTVRVHHPGSAEDLQMFEVRVPPNTDAAVHAHDNNEIIYIVEGEMRVGAHLLKAGASIYIQGRTLYGFVTGSQGVHFLNFRAHHDPSYYTKQQFLDLRAESKK
jgi:uncharacterized cupin superfamily protein